MSSTTAADGEPLTGRTAIVTGASRGIGRECARLLSAAGATLVSLGRDLDALTRLGQELRGRHSEFSIELSDPRIVASVLTKVREYLGGAPDILVNNAAQFQLAPLEETAVADFERTLAVNLTGHFAIVREFLAEMRRRGSGDVVTIGSIADVRPLEGNAAYSASKFALRGLHGVLREETRGSGVRATLVSPGRVDTDIWVGIDAGDRHDVGPRAGMITAGDVAAAVLFAVTRPPSVNIDELRLSRA